MKRIIVLLVLLAACSGGPDMPANGVSVPDGVSATAKVATPDAAAFTIAGDLDVRVKVSLTDWSAAPDSSNGTFVAHWLNTGDQRGWSFAKQGTTTALLFGWSTAGTDATTTIKVSDVTGFANGSTQWIRVVHDVDNGAGGNDVKFYTSADGVSWGQLGATQTTAGTTSHYDSTDELRIGAPTSGVGLGATFYSVEIRDGIDGTIVANPDFVNDPAHSATAIRDSRGNLWTLSGSAALVSHVKPAALGLAT